MRATGVTGCIVARDEAAVLPGCIASLRGAVEEILVVDHGSRDATAAVAAELGARVIASTAEHHELARNDYLEAARTPWVLVLDADERLSTRGRAAVPSLANDASSDVWGFALERFDYLGGGRWASTRLVRLFRADPRVRYFRSRAHAAVAPAIDAADKVIEPADAPLHHLDALLPRDHDAKRAGMRARLAAEIASGAPPILRCFYALELFAVGDDRGADEQLARALAESARCEPVVSLFRAQQHRARGRLEAAAREAARALSLPSRVFRGRASAYAVLADAQDRLGDRGAAIATTRAALAEEPTLASHHLNLAALLEEGDEARSHLEAARRENPWLSSSRILGEGARLSIFRQQDALVARVADPRAARQREGRTRAGARRSAE